MKLQSGDSEEMGRMRDDERVVAKCSLIGLGARELPQCY